MMVDRFAPLVRAAQEAGDFAGHHEPEALVELVDIVVDGLNRRQLTDTFATDFQRVGRIAIAMFLAALQPEGTNQEAREREP